VLRLRNEAAFAHLCGVAPLLALSGKTHRHRLNLGGNRQANHALYGESRGARRQHPRVPSLGGEPSATPSLELGGRAYGQDRVPRAFPKRGRVMGLLLTIVIEAIQRKARKARKARGESTSCVYCKSALRNADYCRKCGREQPWVPQAPRQSAILKERPGYTEPAKSHKPTRALRARIGSCPLGSGFASIADLAEPMPATEPVAHPVD
jgi:hypothetical protein